MAFVVSALLIEAALSSGVKKRFDLQTTPGCLKEQSTTMSRDITRGRTHMFAGGEGVIFSLENGFCRRWKNTSSSSSEDGFQRTRTDFNSFFKEKKQIVTQLRASAA